MICEHSNKSLCDSCTNNGCILQSGIIRNHCDFYKTESGECGMTYKENELYREIEIFLDDIKVGEAEIDLKGKMLSRLAIYEPYQNKNIGTQVVTDLTERYGLTNLWVNADNERAIHVYEKCGYKKVKPAMYLMKRSDKE